MALDPEDSTSKAISNPECKLSSFFCSDIACLLPDGEKFC